MFMEGYDIDQSGVSKAFSKFIRENNFASIHFKDPDWIITS